MEALGIGLIILLVLLFLGMSVAMSFGVLAIFLVYWFQIDTAFLVPVAFYQMKSVVLLATPFFILIGVLMSITGMSKRLVDFIVAFVGSLKGSLGVVAVVASALFGTIGGTCSAAVAAIGSILIPEMEKEGYPRGYATALVSCSSVLGQLIPPSVPMIFFALLTQQSVPACWLATVLPGGVVIVVFSVMNCIMVRKFPNLKTYPRLPLKERIQTISKASRSGIPTMILPVLILGSVYGGIATPTESAAVGFAYLLITGFFVLKTLNISKFRQACITAGSTAGVILIMLFFVLMTSRILSLQQIPSQIAEIVMTISPNKYVILLMMNIFLLIIGMLMEETCGTVLAALLLYPIAQNIGVHPLHFAAIVGVNLGLGNVTPPTAPILYLGGRIGNCNLEEYIKPALTLMWVGMLPVLILTTYIPAISLFLPRLAGFVH